MSFILTPRGRREVILEDERPYHLYGDFPLTHHSMNCTEGPGLWSPKAQDKVPKENVRHMYNSEYALKQGKWDKNKIEKHWNKYYDLHDKDPEDAIQHHARLPQDHRRMLDKHYG